MPSRITSVILSVIVHTLLLYTAWSVLVPKPQPPATSKNRGLNITIIRTINEEAVAIPSEVPASTVTKMPPEPTLVERKQAPASEKTIYIPPPSKKQHTSNNKLTIAQSQVTKSPSQIVKKQLQTEQNPTLPPIKHQMASYKPSPEIAYARLSSFSETDTKKTDSVKKSTTNTIPASTILKIESSYTAALLEAIERHRRYPLRARHRGDEGEVLIDFTILEDGKITSIQIASSSHSSSLDRAASKALEQLKQFKPIPHQLQRTHWNFRIPVRFALN